MDSSVTLGIDPPGALLTVAGEFDAEATPELEDKLDIAVQQGCTLFKVDVGAVTFVDATALGLLVRLQNSLKPLEGQVVVVAASEHFRWAATVAGLGDAFGLDRLPGFE